MRLLRGPRGFKRVLDEVTVKAAGRLEAAD